MKNPSFQFYPTDYLGSQRVQMMSLEEEGAYIRLLASCWQHGSIPSDPASAARLIGKGATVEIATSVLAMFVPSATPGRLVHDRLEFEREKQKAYREAQSLNGKAGAQRRWHSDAIAPSLNGHGDATISPMARNSFPSPSSDFSLQTPSPEKPVKPGRAKSLPDDEWLKGLESDGAWAGIPVFIEVAKCRRWCAENRKSFSRLRIVNWLNRIERPLKPMTQLDLSAGRPAPLVPIMR